VSEIDGRSVVVVGGGFGGLSAACYLADAGADVTILEKNARVGGLAGRLEGEGYGFDTGPSWYMMPEVFGRFFADFGRSPAEYYSLRRLDPSYRVFFKDGDALDVSVDTDALASAFEARETGAGDALREYLREARRTYEGVMEPFVYTDRPRYRDWIDPELLEAGPIGLRLWGSLDGYVAKFFDSRKLRQVVQYAAVFLGGSPESTPRLYSLMSHVDLSQGVYYPDGGIAGLVDGIAALARDLGVTIETDTEVTEITRGREGFFVATERGVRRADLVVSDADYAHTEQELLPAHERGFSDEYWEKRDLAPSAFVLFLGVEGTFDELEHHNVVMPTDWRPHFEEIFEGETWASDPVYYVCNNARTDPSVAPEGHAALTISVPVPVGTDDSPARRERYRDLLLDDLRESTGVDLHGRIEFEQSFCVSDFEERYHARRGTLGLASTLRQTGPFRPPHRSRAVEGLYFTGSYTTPGIGMPICLVSGEHAVNAVLADLDE
jgi:1-hydroxy-2-isopentenylcarotenoid 3,4-desaturase